MQRRNFLKRLFGMAAVVALAPQLCFRVRPEIPSIVAQEAFVKSFFYGKRISDEAALKMHWFELESIKCQKQEPFQDAFMRNV